MIKELSHPINVVFYSIVPSPYQRDLFYELSCLPEVNLRVYYLEHESPDSPWPSKPLEPFECILPGSFLAWGASRFHINYHLPQVNGTDIIVLNGYQNFIAQLLLHTQPKPCLFWGEKIVANSSGMKGKLQNRLAAGLNHCQAIVAIGTRAQQDYKLRFPNKPIFNIPYYCDLTRFVSDRSQRHHQCPTILFCGQMIARKGVDLLLQAFERLIHSGYKARLLLVGRQAELTQMLQVVTDQTREWIEYAGFQSPDNLHPFFHQADLFVLPSRYDGWGVVVNQALGAGLPIICSDAVGASQDLVESGKNGMIFSTGDVTALYNALAYYCQDPARVRQASQASFEKAQLWSPQVGAQRWVEVLKQIRR